MDDNESFVRVTIFGQDYTVKAPADSTYIKDIAKYVDEKMREVQQGLTDPQSTTRIAMLAAMNIADEYFPRAMKKISSLLRLRVKYIQSSKVLTKN